MIKSRSPIFRFLVIASVLLCVVSSAKAQDKVALGLHLRAGQTFDTGYVMETETAETFQEKHIAITMLMRFGMHNEVLNVDDAGTIKLKTTYESVAFESHMTDGGKINITVNYDSKKPPKKAPAGEEAMTELVGQSLIMTISSQGKIVKIEGMDAIVQKIMAGRKDTVERDLTSKKFKESIGDRGKFTSNMVFFPELPVAIGDSWKFQSEFSSFLISDQYTLMSLQNGIATLAVRSNLNTDPKSSSFEDSGISMNFKGTRNGVMRVDERTGLTQSSELHQSMAGNWSISSPENAPGKREKMIIPVKMKSTMRGWIVQLPQ